MMSIGSVRALLAQDGGKVWFAQGLEIDYGAQGNTPEEAMDAFANGLSATFREHWRAHGSIEKILTQSSTPPKYWARLSQGAWKHHFHPVSNLFPFIGVDFFEV